MDPITPTDLQTFLSLSEINAPRAQMLLCDALAQALAIVTVGVVADDGATWDNLPSGASGVIRGAVGRLYLNPSGATAETAGPFSITRSAQTGAIFSDAEIATLRTLGGTGGAFTVDPTPTDAGQQLPIWDENITVLDPGEDLLEGGFGGEWF